MPLTSEQKRGAIVVEVVATLLMLVPAAESAAPSGVASGVSANATTARKAASDIEPVRSKSANEVREIDLVFDGLRSSEGKVAIAIFDARSSAGFPASEGAIRHLVVDNKNVDGHLSVRVSDLPAGEYAFAVFHDEDANGSFKFGMFGIPREGIAFSNNPRIFFGPPSFDSARVNVGTTDVVRMEMKYF
jgi:uncharacterized protein (DUF2141 family)